MYVQADGIAVRPAVSRTRSRANTRVQAGTSEAAGALCRGTGLRLLQLAVGCCGSEDAAVAAHCETLFGRYAETWGMYR